MNDPLTSLDNLFLDMEFEALKVVFINLSCESITSLLCEAEALNADIGAVDDPLILLTITFLAVEADPLNIATDELIAWSVTVKEELRAMSAFSNFNTSLFT